MFGEFELDASSLELRRAGKRVALQRRPLQLLLYLSRHANRMVPSAELLSEVWEGVTVTEASLRGAIRVLRRELAGSATIEILRGYGYRFVPAAGPTTPIVAPALDSTPDFEIGAISSGHAFVGRREELATLKGALERALQGNPGPVLVAAPAGTGKTWLTREFARLARLQGFRALIGQAWEGGGTPAFWPWGPVLEQLSYLSEAVEIDQHPEGPATRFRLFADVVSLLKRRAEQEPLLLVFEDLHWAEESTLLLLRFVVEQLQGSRLLLVGTYRDNDLGAREGCARLIGSLQARGQVLVLKPFGKADVASLLRAETSLDVTESLAARVLRWTGGSPLFVRELIPWLEQQGGSPDFSSLSVPAGIREAIRAQLGPLAEAARTLLSACAVLGEDFEIPLLNRVATVPSDEAQRLIHDAVMRRVLTQVAPGKYRFTHALVREVLLKDLPDLERAMLHHRIGLVLEKLAVSNDAHAAALAFHFEQALPVLDDTEQPIRHALTAARAAMTRFAYEQARDHCRAALAIANSLGSSVVDRERILIQLGEALRYSGATEEAKATFRELAALGRHLGQSLVIAEAARGYVRSHKEDGVVDRELVALVNEALSELPRGDHPLRAELLAALARALYFDSNRERQLQLSLEAIEIARRLGSPSTLALALASRAFVVWGSADAELLRQWPSMVDVAIESAEEANDYETLMDVCVLAVPSWLMREVHGEAIAALERVEDLARRLHHPSGLYFAAVTRAAIALHEGRLGDAPDLIDRANGIGRPLGRAAANFHLFQNLLLARDAGTMGTFVEYGPSLIALTNTPLAAKVIGSMLYIEAGLPQSAQKELETVSTVTLDQALGDPNWLTWHVLLGRTLAQLGPSKLARHVYQRLHPYEGLTAVCGSVGIVAGSVSLTLGSLARSEGELEAALSHLSLARQSGLRSNARPEVARASLELALTLQSLGRRDEALSATSEAEQVASEVGMRKVLSEAAALREQLTIQRSNR